MIMILTRSNSTLGFKIKPVYSYNWDVLAAVKTVHFIVIPQHSRSMILLVRSFTGHTWKLKPRFLGGIFLNNCNFFFFQRILELKDDQQETCHFVLHTYEFTLKYWSKYVFKIIVELLQILSVT